MNLDNMKNGEEVKIETEKKPGLLEKAKDGIRRHRGLNFLGIAAVYLFISMNSAHGADNNNKDESLGHKGAGSVDVHDGGLNDQVDEGIIGRDANGNDIHNSVVGRFTIDKSGHKIFVDKNGVPYPDEKRQKTRIARYDSLVISLAEVDEASEALEKLENGVDSSINDVVKEINDGAPTESKIYHEGMKSLMDAATNQVDAIANNGSNKN